MRFMVLIKADKNSEDGVMPSERLLTEMGRFNEALAQAGLIQAGEGLHPSAQGVRVRFSGDAREVVYGPFPETRQLVAGFWIWQVASREEAIEWARRCPNPMDGESEIELRQIFEAADFDTALAPEAQAPAALHRQRAGMAQPHSPAR